MNLLLMSAHTLQHHRVFNLASSLISLDQACIHQRCSSAHTANTLQHYRIFNFASSLISLDQAHIH